MSENKHGNTLANTSATTFGFEVPSNFTQEVLDIVDNPANVAAFEATAGNLVTWSRPTREHLTAVNDRGELVFVQDAGADMGGPFGYRRLNPLSMGSHLIFTMYHGTTGYGGNEDFGTMRLPYKPKPGEFVLAGRMYKGYGASEEAERLIKSWSGPDCRLLYATEGHDEPETVQLLDPVTSEVVFPDSTQLPRGINTEVIVAIGDRPAALE